MVVALTEESETPIEKTSHESQPSDFRRSLFEWKNLKKKCQQMDLEDTYQTYLRRIFCNYLKSFMKIHVIFAVLHSVAVIVGDQRSDSNYDCYLYLVGSILTCLCIWPYLNNDFVIQYPCVAYIVSWSACTVMAFTDFLIGLMAFIFNEDILRHCYCGYTISCLYLFMPIPAYGPVILLSLFISSLYGTYSTFISFSKPAEDESIVLDLRYLIPDLLFILGLNVVGICFRIRHDYATRRVFMTRRLNIEEGLLLKFAKDQENNLLISIIPVQIAKKIGQEIKARIERFKNPHLTKPQYATEFSRKLFIEAHYDVSILFADLVNYTHLTTTLDIKTLVDTLHDLFQRFDHACEEFNVMRIKFLGDCYYGVAGIPKTHPFHAHCCIEFGRSIIEQISEVRIARDLNIDMRIGVHSGNVLSGIIGASKWQYDIWSKDVDIASHMEQTGVPGRVHISENSLQFVEAFYEYEEGTEKAKMDPLLSREHIATYLIIKPSEFMTQSKEWKTYKNRNTSKPLYKSNFQLMTGASSLDEMYTEEQGPLNIKSIQNRANTEIARDIKKLPIYKLGIKDHLFTRMPRLNAYEMEDFSANRNISTGCLWFSYWSWELSYNREKDELFKISITMSYLVLMCVMGMEGSNEIIHDIYSFAFLYGVAWSYSTALVILTWLHYIRTKSSVKLVKRPRNRFILYLYRISTILEMKPSLRISVFITHIFCIIFIAFVHSIFCDPVALENDNDLMYEFLKGGRRTLCFNSWSVTECLVLCMAMLFTFNRIPYFIQLVAGVSITIYYLLIIFIEFDLVYECSLVTNKTIRAETSHIWSLLTVMIIYQLMARHIIYISKIEAISKWRLEKKKDNARVTNESIKILLHNILPTHVVSIYLSRHIRNEPYYEQHEYVAVMFATIIYARSGSIELRLLNEIICDFDEVLSYYKASPKVEKIKVANWSYMVACGFDIPSNGASVIKMSAKHKSMFFPNKRQYPTISSNVELSAGAGSNSPLGSQPSQHDDDDIVESDENESDFDNNTNSTDEQKRNVLLTTSNFALDLLRSMHSFNITNQLVRSTDEPDIMLRIGISSGEVMAGVVGSSQAHYDIWGNAVNMASRMDSTGEPGRIQVTEEAANILKSFNIVCKSRGLTLVKGRGKIPTYFVQMTDNYEFETVDKKEVHVHKYQQD